MPYTSVLVDGDCTARAGVYLCGRCRLSVFVWKGEHLVAERFNGLVLHTPLDDTERLNQIPCCRPVEPQSVLTIPT